MLKRRDRWNNPNPDWKPSLCGPTNPQMKIKKAGIMELKRTKLVFGRSTVAAWWIVAFPSGDFAGGNVRKAHGNRQSSILWQWWLLEGWGWVLRWPWGLWSIWTVTSSSKASVELPAPSPAEKTDQGRRIKVCLPPFLGHYLLCGIATSLPAAQDLPPSPNWQISL